MTQECDPNKVYPDTQQGLWGPLITTAIHIPLALVIATCSPFVIYMPFTRKKLNNTCRKIISMIVLSDLVSTLANLELSVGQYWNHRPTLTIPCVVATMTLAVTQRFSLMWSFALLIYVLLTLLDKIDWGNKKNTFFMICHFLIWPFGITSALWYFLFSDKLVYNNEYLTIHSCRPNFTFVFTEDRLDCLVPEDLRQTFIISIFIYFFFGLSSIIIFVAIFRLAYKLDKNRKRSSSSSPTGQLNFMFTKSLSHQLLNYARRFAVTSFVYIICSLPICVFQLYLVLNGPSRTGIATAYRYYNILSPPLVAFINITAYGLMSPIFKEEIKLVLRNLSFSMPFAKPLYEFGTTNGDTSFDESTNLI